MAEEKFGLSYVLKLVDELSGPLDKVGEKFRQLSKHHTDAGRSLRETGKTLTAFASTTVAGVSALALHEAKKFDNAFVGMKLSINRPLEEVKKLKSTLQDMSMTTGHAPELLMELAQIGGRAKVSDIAGFSKMMADLAMVTGEFAGEGGAREFHQLSIALGLSEKELGSLASTLAYASKNFDVTAGAVGSTMQQLSGLTAITPTTNQQLAAMSIWANSFGQEGGNALIRMMNLMTDAAKNGSSETLAWFSQVSGIPSKKFIDLFETNAPAAFAAFAEGLKKANEEDVNVLKILDRIGMGGTKMVRVLTTAANSAKSLTDIQNNVNENWEKQVYLTKAAEEYYKTWDRTVAQLSNTWKELLVQFGDPLIEPMKWLIGALRSFIALFTHLPMPVKLVIGVLGGLLAVAGPVLIALGTMVGHIALLKLAFPALAASAGTAVSAVAAFLAPLTVALVAAGAVANLISTIVQYKNTFTTPGALRDFFGFVVGEDIEKRYANQSNANAAKAAMGTRTETYVTVGLADGLESKGVKNKSGDTNVDVERELYSGQYGMAW